MIRRYTGMLMMAAVGLALVTSAQASVVVALDDVNSHATFCLDADDPLTQIEGLSSWTIDGVERMQEQWFWFRLGDSGPERRISDLTYEYHAAIDLNGDPGDDTMYVRYGGEGLKVELTVQLVGGSDGSGKSDLAETIRITNTSTQTMDLNFFQYANFDLSDDADTVVISGDGPGVPGNTVYQMGDGAWVAETVVTRSGGTLAHHQAGLKDGSDVNDILKALTDGDADDLTDATGPLNGDAVWGFQWEAELAPGDTLIISKDKNIVPEPATMMLMGTGAGLALLVRRRRR